ncbi:MAG: hypothetical protein LBK95_15100 [Bifidobacteriaceae bacterium]|jgi:hypothetical protein|nr:hypothetical protein [Bifidobacteriaceae bacterium]
MKRKIAAALAAAALLLGLGSTAALATLEWTNNGQLYYYTNTATHTAEYFNNYYSHKAGAKTSATGYKWSDGACKKMGGPSSFISVAKGLPIGRGQLGLILC